MSPMVTDDWRSDVALMRGKLRVTWIKNKTQYTPGKLVAKIVECLVGFLSGKFLYSRDNYTHVRTASEFIDARIRNKLPTFRQQARFACDCESEADRSPPRLRTSSRELEEPTSPPIGGELSFSRTGRWQDWPVISLWLWPGKKPCLF